MVAVNELENRTAGAVQGPGRILVVDDHPLFADALTMTLATAMPSVSIVSASTLAAALTKIQEAPPDAVMLDLNLPDVDGFDGLVRVRAAAPKARILVVSSMAENAIIAAALTAGADGFMAKDAARATLLQAFDRLLAGETVVPEGYVPPAADALTEDAQVIERLRTLTPRQARILDLVCAGKLNKQIAYDLSISETTVKAHVTAILRKLSVSSRTQAVLVAQKAQFSSVLRELSERA
ncbi:MAG: response regulator transcription factor [Pseudomonadota bacterium]